MARIWRQMLIGRNFAFGSIASVHRCPRYAQSSGNPGNAGSLLRVSPEARFKLPNWSGELARITESERGHAAGVLVKDQCAGDWRYGALTALWLDGPGISRLTRSPLDRTAHRAARRGPASETGASDGEAATPGPGALRTGILTDDSLFYAILTCAVVRPPPQPIDWR